MKQKSIKFSKVILLYFIIVFSSCENENLTTDNPNPSFSTAKSWFEEFKAKENFQPIFKDLIYNWQDASITSLTNGTKAVTVPVVYPNQSQEYAGHKILYFYPKKSGEDFDVTLFEFIPNPKKVQTRQNTIDLNTFDGYIINWDLRNGFIRGSKFEQNLSVNDISLKVIYSKNNNNYKDAPIIALDEVVIIGKPRSNTGGSYTFVITGNYSSFGNGTNSGNYANSPYVGGGRGDSNSNSTTKTNPCDQLKKMIDPTNTTNIKAQIDWLKSKVNALVNNKEFGVEVQKRMNADETFRYEYNRIDSPNEFSVSLTTGGMNIGGIHSHPENGYAMFSFQDVRFLLNAYDGASSTRSDDVFTMMVCKDNNGVTNTYNLKIDNIDALRNNVNSVWNNPKYSRYTTDDTRRDAIHKDQAIIYKNSNGELEKSFLEQFKDFGISLYKTDATNTSFNKLALNSSKTVTSTPCN